MSTDNDCTMGRPVRAYNADGYFSDYSTEEIVTRRLNYFKGWKCAAGVENINIDFDGLIQRASCGIVADINGRFRGHLGHIYEGELLENDNWITCKIETCSCGADMFIPKHRADTDKALLRKYQNAPRESGKQLESDSNRLGKIAAVERTHFANCKQIFWEISRRCNLDCSYCPSYVHNKTDRHRTWEELENAYKLLKNSFLRGHPGNFAISGGEPTVNSSYMKLAKLISSDGNKLSTHSNGTKRGDYYAELIQYSDLNLSIHFEYIDKFKDKIIDTLTRVVETKMRRDALGQKRGHCEVMFMILPGRLDEALSLEKEIVKIPGFINFCTHTFMPLRTNDLVEEKNLDGNRRGNQLRTEYSDNELTHMGYRTSSFKLKAQSLNDPPEKR